MTTALTTHNLDIPYHARRNTWLDNPRFRTLAEKEGWLEDMEKEDAAQRLYWNAPEQIANHQKFIQELNAKKYKGNDYQLLGLVNHTGELTRKIVQSAYRKQAHRCHPDTGGNPSQFKKLNAAYQRILATLPR